MGTKRMAPSHLAQCLFVPGHTTRPDGSVLSSTAYDSSEPAEERANRFLETGEITWG
jgi:hypothetical protein